MGNLMIVGVLIFIVAVMMTMVGKGGGNFYVVILALSSISMHQAAATGQFILFSASMAALVIFQKNKTISWPLVFLIGGFTSLSALGGGYFSHFFSSDSLKIIFSIMLVTAGVVMLIPVAETRKNKPKRYFGSIQLKTDGETLQLINLWIVIPVTLLTGFASGMVGVSGGSFLVPLMVLVCGVSMRTAVGTASTLIAVTALMGFAGHAFQGDFDPLLAVPLAGVTILGGVIGGLLSMRTKPKNLKHLFAYTNWLAAGFMIINMVVGQ